MTIQNEITKQARLLDEKGHLTVSGWARDLLLKYDRKDIKARSYRIKEWDYYLVLADDFGCAFTISDLSYIGMVSVSFLDFKNLKDYTKPIITILPMGKYQMPSTSITGDVHFENKDLKLDFINEKSRRIIRCSYKNIADNIYGATSLFKLDGNSLSVLPFHHAFGLIIGIFGPFFWHKSVFINESLKNLMADIKISKPQTLIVVPVFVENFYKVI